MKAGPRKPAGRMIDEGSSELGSAAPPAFFTPICAQARTGFSTVVSAWSSGKPCGRNTSSLDGRPRLEADAAQEIGGRGEGVGQAGPDVDAAVAVAVDRPTS